MVCPRFKLSEATYTNHSSSFLWITVLCMFNLAIFQSVLLTRTFNLIKWEICWHNSKFWLNSKLCCFVESKLLANNISLCKTGIQYIDINKKQIEEQQMLWWALLSLWSNSSASKLVEQMLLTVRKSNPNIRRNLQRSNFE